MALPFLTKEEINPTFVGIHLELLRVTDLESSFKNYFVNQWIDGSQSLPIFTMSSLPPTMGQNPIIIITSKVLH